MCLYVLGKLGISVAETDILVYKALTLHDDGGLVTPWRREPVRFDDAGMARLAVSSGIIREVIDDYDTRQIHEGIHAYYDEDTANGWSHVFPAVIPKGARYCVGHLHHIVASEMIIFKDAEAFKRWAEERPGVKNIVTRGAFGFDLDDTFGMDFVDAKLDNI